MCDIPDCLSPVLGGDGCRTGETRGPGMARKTWQVCRARDVQEEKEEEEEEDEEKEGKHS